MQSGEVNGYNIGGATVGVFVNETDNSDFTVGKKEKNDFPPRYGVLFN